MLRSLNFVLNFVMKSSAAEKALSDSMAVGGTIFKSSMRKRILLVFSPVIFECVSYYY